MPSPKKNSPKSSPKKGGKNSPKSKKDSPKGKKGEALIQDDVFVYVRPPSPPPPPVPPKGPLLSRMRRELWYPYSNVSPFYHREWFWTPFCPVVTSWGDVWVTDPPNRRILRYKFDPVISKIKLLGTIITRGLPYMMVEVPVTGRIAVLNTCPLAQKTTLTLYDPVELKEDFKADFKYMAKPPPPECVLPDTGPDDLPIIKYELPDDSSPKGICCNKDLLFVLCQPIQQLKLLNPITLKPYEVRVENAYSDESSCVHLASSGGCAATENQLFVCATRPARVQVFWMHRRKLFDRMDRVDIVWYAELGLDRLSVGEPYGVQIDTAGLVVVSDSRAGHLHVYNVDKRPPGPWRASLPHGETCCLGSWKVDKREHVRPGHLSIAKNGTMCLIDRWENKIILLADKTVLRWIDDTFLCLDEIPLLRPVVDPLMPKPGLPEPPLSREGIIHRTTSADSIRPTDEELLNDCMAKRYKTKAQMEAEALEAEALKKESPTKKPAGGKNSPGKKSPGKKSPGKKSPGKK